jgi:hypothetical protein
MWRGYYERLMQQAAAEGLSSGSQLLVCPSRELMSHFPLQLRIFRLIRGGADDR